MRIYSPYDPQRIPEVAPLSAQVRSDLSNLRGTKLTDAEWDDLCEILRWHVMLECGVITERPSNGRVADKATTRIKRARKKGLHPRLQANPASSNFLNIAGLLNNFLEENGFPSTELRHLAVAGMLHHARPTVMKHAGPITKKSWQRPFFDRYERYVGTQAKIERLELTCSRAADVEMDDELDCLKSAQREDLTMLATEFRNLFRQKGITSKTA